MQTVISGPTVKDMVEQTSRPGSVYLTRVEAANYLNLAPSWLANNAKRGPRYIKVGGVVRYSVSALDAFMSAHEGKHR